MPAHGTQHAGKVARLPHQRSAGNRLGANLRASPQRPRAEPAQVSDAVLISGGLDSAILLGDALRHDGTIYPIYIRCGHVWETVELAHLRRYLAALARPALQSLT